MRGSCAQTSALMTWLPWSSAPPTPSEAPPLGRPCNDNSTCCRTESAAEAQRRRSDDAGGGERLEPLGPAAGAEHLLDAGHQVGAALAADPVVGMARVVQPVRPPG